MTQPQLAGRADMSQGYLSQLENGQTKSPSVALAMCLARGLGVSLMDLLEYVGCNGVRRPRAELNVRRATFAFAQLPPRKQVLALDVLEAMGNGG